MQFVQRKKAVATSTGPGALGGVAKGIGTGEPSAAKGEKLAQTLCSSCHVVDETSAASVPAGIPTLRAKQNIEIKGVGTKFSGVYYCRSLRHSFGDAGYSCELTLRKNALGKGAGAKSDPSKGRPNDGAANP